MLKRGQLEFSFIVYYVYAVILLVSVLIIGYLILMEIDSNPREQIIEAKEIGSRNVMLVNFLNLPVGVDDREISVGDLIGLWSKDEVYKDVLVESVGEILEGFPKEGDLGWNLRIYKDDELKLTVGRFIRGRGESVVLPGYNNEKLRAELFLGERAYELHI